MATCTTFHGFRPHDSIEIIDVDHVDCTIRFRSLTEGTRTTLPFRGVDVARSSLIEGRVVDVQYGKITSVEAEYSRTRRAVRTGDRKICAMRHPRPTITPLALSVMRWSLGDAECIRQLAMYAERANTLQREASYDARGQRIELDLGGGCIKAMTDLGRGRTSHQGVHLLDDIPDVVISAIPGMDVGQVVGHPALIAAGRIATASAKPEGGAYIHLVPATISITDAVESLALPLAA